MSTVVRARCGCPAAGYERRPRLYWWVEILAILGFYLVYSAIRNIHGGISGRRRTRSITPARSCRWSTTSASFTS